MHNMSLHQLKVGIKGAGEMASGLAWRLYQANIRKIFMLEVAAPLAVRRAVSFCEALYDRMKSVEGVSAVRAEDKDGIYSAWQKHQIPVIADPDWKTTGLIKPDIMIDATIAKKNLGTRIDEAPLVIGLGPGFEAGRDVHLVVETNRGHNLGRVLAAGSAEGNTGIPGNISGFTVERVLRAPNEGTFKTDLHLGMTVRAGDSIGQIGSETVTAAISGVLRGLIKPGTLVTSGMKIGDIDPRCNPDYCPTISDKARAVAGGVLEAILQVYNMPSPVMQGDDTVETN